MKKNMKKGFVMAETIVVSTIVLAAIIAIYVQFMSINNSYYRSFNYNTIDDIYALNRVKKFILDDNYNYMINELQDNAYIDLSDCSASHFTEYAYCKTLLATTGIKSLILAHEDVSNLKQSLRNDNTLSQGMRTFIKTISSNDSNGYRLIAEFDDRYSTLKLLSSFGDHDSLIGTAWDYDYTGDYQEFVAPEDGVYQIELWGASGNNIYNSHVADNPAYGGYTSGNITLSTNERIYIYVGGSGQVFNACLVQGTNAGSGGATDIRLVSGEWNNFDSLKSRIMVAGGAGGSYKDATATGGGSAGGLESYSITHRTYPVYASGQTFSGLNNVNGEMGTFGIGGNTLKTSYNCGAGGYYGGSGGPAGGGGSSFISGHNGCDAISASSTSSNIIHTGQSNHYSGYVFTNTVMIDGQGYNWTNVKGSYVGQIQPDGTTTIGHSGNGYAKITLIETASTNDQYYKVDTKSMVDNVEYANGKSDCTFDIYVNNIKVASNVIDWEANVIKNSTVRIVTESGGYDETITVNEDTTLTPEYRSYTIENIIKNGSFENGFDNWLNLWLGTNTYDATIANIAYSGSKSLYHNYSVGTDTIALVLQEIDNPIVNHKYYGSVMYYLNSDSLVFGNIGIADGRFEVFNNDLDGVLVFAAYYNDISVPRRWTQLSNIYNLDSSRYRDSQWVVRDFIRGHNSEVYTDDLIIVDLTKAFGAGNEPSKYWCDKHINWFEGTTTIYK